MDIITKVILVIKTISNFWIAFIDKAGFVESDVLYKTRKNLKFLARGGTEDMAEIVVVASGSEYNIADFNLPSMAVILDLGGHIGTFSIWISKSLKSRVKVFAYEPDMENFKFFQKNLELNKSKNIHLFNLAISDYWGKGYLRKKGMKTDAYFLDVKHSRKPNCDVTTLMREQKKLGYKRIDLLKMDIEGGEYSIFSDARSYRFIASNVRNILIECHNLDKYRNENKLLESISKDFTVLSHHKNVYALKNMNQI